MRKQSKCQCVGSKINGIFIKLDLNCGICDTPTAVPTKSDSNVIFCLQLLSKS